MAVIPLSSQTFPPQLRSLNPLRDLPAVADLIDVCFVGALDEEGRHSVQNMRRASEDDAFLRWANRMADSLSLPLSGFVWEENGEIIGNVSLVPYRHARRRYYLIANVAVHPDYRRRGIGRMLTQAAIQRARQKGATEIWLHVREDNPGAIRLYEELGFRERARRTSWRWSAGSDIPKAPYQPITRRRSQDWPEQERYLRHFYPDLLSWYQPLPWNFLKPGFFSTLQRFLLEVEVEHWVIRQPTSLVCLTWLPASGAYDTLLLAAPPEGGDDALHNLLLHSEHIQNRRHRGLALELPAGVYREVIERAGFQARRTLLWMRLER